MMNAIRARADRDSEEGFTLIELMVVVLIIGILLAIAIPTFLGARNRANDRSAQSDLRNALTGEKTLFTDSQNYVSTTGSVNVNITALAGVEPALNWGTAVAANPRIIVATAAGTPANSVVLEAESVTGTCWYIADFASGSLSGTYYGQNDCSSALAAPSTIPTAANSSSGNWGLAF